MLQITQLPKLIVARRSSAVLAMVIIVMIWAGIGVKYAGDVREDLRDALRTTQNFAMVFEENVLRSIGEIDKALLYLRKSIESRNATTDFGTIANTTDVLSEIIVQVAIIDAQGIMRASNAGPQPAPAIDLSDREHYRAHLHGRRDVLFISKPVVGRASGRPSVQFTRRFLDEKGSFGGVVVASLDPEHLTRFYEKIDIGRTASIALIGNDGVVRSSGGASGDLFVLGQNIKDTELFARMTGGGNATFEAAGGSPDNPRLMSIRRVPGHPLWVTVSVSAREIYNASWATLALNALAGLLLTAIILAAVEWMLRVEAKRLEAEAHIAQLASEDPLTGLPNRRVLRFALDHVVAERARLHNSLETAVLFMDLDRFKVVNDTLGHRVGDLLLQQVAERLKAALGDHELLARLGGDEFAVLVPVVDERSSVGELAQRLIDAVGGQIFDVDGQQVRSGMSIGIAMAPRDGDNADDLLIAADLALYAVKASGRGTYEFYERSMTDEVAERRRVEMDLRDAIEATALELHYQPIVALAGGVITGFEALTRWQHRSHGAISPAVFIPVAEDSRLIIPLGEWVLREACRQAVKWPAALNVAVNLSPIQLLAPDFVDLLRRILTETGLDPSRLELEITERVLIDDTNNMLSILCRLKRLGVRIAMDDFGTGYSSLSYLRSFPFDKIKVDRAFVSDLSKGAEHLAIVEAVVGLARALGMMTTAEGVETAEQCRLLTLAGCDEVQGYLFSRPVPIESVAEILATWPAGGTLAA
jgi:diguanylate cyclase (GGDEF)-like protein